MELNNPFLSQSPLKGCYGTIKKSGHVWWPVLYLINKSRRISKETHYRISQYLQTMIVATSEQWLSRLSLNMLNTTPPPFSFRSTQYPSLSSVYPHNPAIIRQFQGRQQTSSGDGEGSEWNRQSWHRDFQIIYDSIKKYEGRSWLFVSLGLY